MAKTSSSKNIKSGKIKDATMAKPSGNTKKEKDVHKKSKSVSTSSAKIHKTGEVSKVEEQTVSQVLAQNPLNELREELLQADKALLEALNNKIELERKYFELNCGQGKQTRQNQDTLPQSLVPSPQSPPLGSRYTDWNLDHQRIETMALANRNHVGGASENCVRAVFREALADVRASIHPTKVAYLGPEFSFTHLAALRYFGTGVELIPVSTIAGIFEETQAKECDFGVVPIENSTDGRIVDTLEMFTKTKVKISGESVIPICHCLIGNLLRSQIKVVYSKAQALSQCRNWLASHLSGVELKTCNSTTQAVELALAGADRGIAAIASAEAAKAYEIDILAENIADNPQNRTRFVVLSKHSYDRKGNDKTSILFQLKHVAGTLADALNIFKRNHLNLTWIESFPVQNSPQSSKTASAENEYLFFVEMEGHFKDLKIRRAIDGLSKRTVRLEILGSYPADEK